MTVAFRRGVQISFLLYLLTVADNLLFASQCDSVLTRVNGLTHGYLTFTNWSLTYCDIVDSML